MIHCDYELKTKQSFLLSDYVMLLVGKADAQRRLKTEHFPAICQQRAHAKLNSLIPYKKNHKETRKNFKVNALT